ncbi:HPP-domain-containing protein [Gyrodon lividus]|nr:HPP-domain-containing protein [Gyrodon lividus]
MEHLDRVQPLSRVPLAISHWLGYRASPPKPLLAESFTVWTWSFVAAFCGVSLLQAVFSRAHYFIERGVPSIIASYGASAVLIYGAIETPLAQPRALLGGHFISALLGICISKLFQLFPSDRYMDLQWLAGSLSVSVSVVAMQVTKTTHPPAGATALLAAINQEVIDISWYLLPVVLLSSTVVLAVALVVNNIQRRYPIFWFAPVVPPSARPSPSSGDPKMINSSSALPDEDSLGRKSISQA